MASETVPESTSEKKPTIISHSEPPTSYNSQFLEHKDTPWVDYAIHQARLYQKTAQETLDSAIEASRSRLSQILSTSSAYLHQTLRVLLLQLQTHCSQELKPLRLKILLPAGPRHFLHYKALRLLLSEEPLISRADAKVKQLRQSLDAIKAESEKLEKSATQAEQELIRGRTKLRQAGKQIQGVIRSGYKIERQAEGLKDILDELPRKDASRFRSQVSVLVSETKWDGNALTKKVTKISNDGISV